MTEVQQAQPFIDDHGDSVVEVREILAHRKRGRGWQFLSLCKHAQHHDSVWKPLRDFVHDDKTIMAALRTYIKHHGILQHLH